MSKGNIVAARAKAKPAEPEFDERLVKIVAKAEEPEDRYADFADYLKEEAGVDLDPSHLQIAIHTYKHYQVSDRNKNLTAERREARAAGASERAAAREAKKEERAAAEAERKAAAAAKKAAEPTTTKTAAAASKPSKAAAARAAKPSPTAKRTTAKGKVGAAKTTAAF